MQLVKAWKLEGAGPFPCAFSQRPWGWRHWVIPHSLNSVRLLDFVFYYNQWIDIDAAVLSMEEKKAHFFQLLEGLVPVNFWIPPLPWNQFVLEEWVWFGPPVGGPEWTRKISGATRSGRWSVLPSLSYSCNSQKGQDLNCSLLWLVAIESTTGIGRSSSLCVTHNLEKWDASKLMLTGRWAMVDLNTGKN